MHPLPHYRDSKSRLLKGLTSAQLAQVFADASTRRIAANKVVVHQGDPADHLFLINSGHARYFFITEQGRKLLLFRLLPGDVFGGAAILSERMPYLVGTETVKETQVCVWPRSKLERLAEKHPRLMQNMMRITYDYLGWYAAAHVGLTCDSAAQRFAEVLLTLAHTVGQRKANGIEIEATNEELASAAAVTRFTASRLMSQWQRAGIVVKRWRRLVILSPERLLPKG
jgi:CRP-like cAMP-binding protein